MSAPTSEGGVPPRTCPQCKHENPGWLLVCTRCGSALPEDRGTSSPPFPAEVEQIPPEPARAMGGEVSHETIPCLQCGGPLQPQDRFCAHCGAERPVGDNRRATTPVWAFTGISLLTLVVLFLGAFLWFRKHEDHMGPSTPKQLPLPSGSLPAATSDTDLAKLGEQFLTLLLARREDEARRLLQNSLDDQHKARLLKQARGWIQGWKQVKEVKVAGRRNVPGVPIGLLRAYLEVTGDGGTLGIEIVVPALRGPTRLLSVARAPTGDALQRFLKAVRTSDLSSRASLLEAVSRDEPNAPMVWDELGIACGLLRDYRRAAGAYAHALELDPDNSTYLNNYAWFASLAEIDLQKALKAARQAVQAEPRNSAFLDTLGWVLFKLGDHQQAIENLEQALQTAGPSRSNQAAAAYHLGMVYAKQGDRRQAVRYLRQSLQAEPNGEFSKDARQRLDQLSTPTVGA